MPLFLRSKGAALYEVISLSWIWNGRFMLGSWSPYRWISVPILNPSIDVDISQIGIVLFSSVISLHLLGAGGGGVVTGLYLNQITFLLDLIDGDRGGRILITWITPKGFYNWVEFECMVALNYTFRGL